MFSETCPHEAFNRRNSKKTKQTTNCNNGLERNKYKTNEMNCQGWGVGGVTSRRSAAESFSTNLKFKFQEGKQEA